MQTKTNFMNIIKFGGTSVANSQNIARCIAIIKSKKSTGRTAVVVSALGGVTEVLLNAAIEASLKDKNYKQALAEVEARHNEVITNLIPEAGQVAVTAHVKKELDHLETLLDGCYLLGELSDRTKDLILSFGEILSSYLIAEALKAQGEDALLADSRELIYTNSHFGKAVVNFEITNLHIQHYFNKNTNAVVVLPGFIAQSEDGHATTLGRGGSDYTAAILAAALDVPALEIWTDVNGI